MAVKNHNLVMGRFLLNWTKDADRGVEIKCRTERSSYRGEYFGPTSLQNYYVAVAWCSIPQVVAELLFELTPETQNVF
jgi:hypothetical protein